MDHLVDLPEFSNIRRSSVKNKLFNNIEKRLITMKTLEKSVHLYEPIKKSFDPASKKEFTIKDRILSLVNLEKILDNPQVIKTPVVRNGKQSTLGYQPDVWKGWK